ncbi:unnamed protein product, partial [Ectocarpus sp. 8 AP-2014]
MPSRCRCWCYFLRFVADCSDWARTCGTDFGSTVGLLPSNATLLLVLHRCAYPQPLSCPSFRPLLNGKCSRVVSDGAGETVAESSLSETAARATIFARVVS